MVYDPFFGRMGNLDRASRTAERPVYFQKNQKKYPAGLYSGCFMLMIGI